MRRDHLFKEILKIIDNDYVGIAECESKNDKKQYLAALAKAWKDQTLTDELFYGYVTQYFATLQDPNLRFYAAPEVYVPTTSGFTVRRYGDDLYVTEVTQEHALKVGDVLTTLNKSKPAEHLEYTIGNIVGGDVAERQDWGLLVGFASHAMVRHANGIEEDFHLSRYPLENKTSEISFRMLSDAVAYLRIDSLEEDTVRALCNRNGEELRAAERVIIDLRRCSTGTDDGMYPLLPLAMAQSTTLSSLMGKHEAYTNYSVRNCGLRLAQLERFASENGLSEEPWMVEEMGFWQERSGAGMLLDEITVDEDFEIAGGMPDQRVVIITDTATEGAGERFVTYAKSSPKVCALGRPTHGTIDYFNPMTVSFDDEFFMVYPMSKKKELVDGQGVLGSGVDVDVYVPWTPQECSEDILLAKALSV